MSGKTGSLVLRVPPVAWFIGVFLIGFALDALVFRAPYPAWLDSIRFWIGLALMLPAGYFGFGALGLFLIRRLPLMPGTPTDRLATDGPFALSRNPMYLGLALLHAGLCLVFGLPLTLALLIAPLLLMQFVFIPLEEEDMKASFGPVYDAYGRRVRRWI